MVCKFLHILSIFKHLYEADLVWNENLYESSSKWSLKSSQLNSNFHLRATQRGWWGSSSPCCSVAPKRRLGGQRGQQPPGAVDTEPASVAAALLDVLEKHSGPGKKQEESTNIKLTS